MIHRHVLLLKGMNYPHGALLLGQTLPVPYRTLVRPRAQIPGSYHPCEDTADPMCYPYTWFTHCCISMVMHGGEAGPHGVGVRYLLWKQMHDGSTLP